MKDLNVFHVIYTVYIYAHRHFLGWTFCWQEVPMLWKAGLAQLSSAASPLCILSLIHATIFYWYTHTSMQGHVRRDCVCVIYAYTWESVWQGVSRMFVYMHVECVHSQKHILCLKCDCVCEYKHSAHTACVAWVCCYSIKLYMFQCVLDHIATVKLIKFIEPLHKKQFSPKMFPLRVCRDTDFTLGRKLTSSELFQDVFSCSKMLK